MHRFLLIVIFFTPLFTIPAEAQFTDFVNKAKSKLLGDDITPLEAGLGLKEALKEGSKASVKKLAVENGYYDSAYKILLPEEARVVTNKLVVIPGFSNAEQKLVRKMNQAAEMAANEALDIFVDAITEITFDDAMSILLGDVDAATRYLEEKTYEQLYDAFLPIIQNSLDKVGAREYWKKATKTYNKIPFVDEVNPDLDDHVNKMALNGLFKEVELKEKDIRKNKSARDSELLQRVFAKQD